MKILLACEESQAVTIALRKLGHEAYSCDLLPCSGGHPEWHIQDDVLKHLDDGWDAMIAFPDCTYLTVTGNKWFYHPDDKDLPTDKRRPHPKFPDRQFRRELAAEFFMTLANAPIERIAIENPVGVMSTLWRKPDQIVQPFQFGHKEPKKTCLWLKNLPLLKPTKIVEPEYHTTKSGKRMPKWYAYADKSKGQAHRACIRSKTFPGIANAMAKQWFGNSIQQLKFNF